MNEHTPGPWRSTKRKPGEELNRLIHTKDGRHIAEVFQYQNHNYPDIDPEANAHLITASPDLLEALRSAEDTLKGMIYNFEHETGENVDADINHTMEKIEQAIAKTKPKGD